MYAGSTAFGTEDHRCERLSVARADNAVTRANQVTVSEDFLTHVAPRALGGPEPVRRLVQHLDRVCLVDALNHGLRAHDSRFPPKAYAGPLRPSTRRPPRKQAATRPRITGGSRGGLPRRTVLDPSLAVHLAPWERRYGNRGGPRSGVATGLARPRKTTRPLPPQRVEAVSAGTSGPAHAWGSSQLFATQTLPAGSIATTVMCCSPPPS